MPLDNSSCNNSLVKYFHFKGRDYCLDLNKPKLFYVTPEVQKSLERILKMNSRCFPDEEYQQIEIDQQIVQLKSRGHFSGKLPEVNKADRTVNKLSLAVTSACNFKCRYCYYDEKLCSISNEQMAADVAIKAIDFLCERSPLQVLGIDFFGGEPLLNFSLIQTIVEYCGTKNQKFAFSITTNGSLVKADIAQFLNQHKFVVIISLDGPEEVHNNARRFANGKGTFISVFQGLEILKTALPPEKLTVNVVATKKYPHADRLLEYFQAIGISQIALSTATVPELPEFHLEEDDMNQLIESEKRIFSALLDKEVAYPKYLPITQYMRYLNTGNPRQFRCRVGRENLAISPKGTIYPCHRFMGYPEFVIGDVFNGIDEDKRNYYYDLHARFDQACAGCWARYICGGPCIHDSFVYSGDMTKISTLKCKRARHLIELSAMLYGELASHNKEKLASLIS